jgi:hypothetical protein
VSLRRSGKCAVVGIAVALGMLAAQGVTASAVPSVRGAERAPEPGGWWPRLGVAGRVGASAQPTQVGHSRWRVIYSASTSMAMSLHAVAALGPHDAWAVGFTGRYYAVALHWSGGRWRRVPIPGAFQYFPLYVAGSSPRDVWVFGFQDTTTGQFWRAIRWDGNAWHEVPQPPETGLPVDEVGFLVLGPDDVWFPAYRSCQTSGTTRICSTPVCRWNGQSWVVYHLNGNVTGLAASGPTNIWAVGIHPGRIRPGHNARPLAYRWNGTAWRAVGMPRQAITGFHAGGPVIDTSGPRAVWIGSESEQIGGGALLIQWNGRKWRELQSQLIGGTAVIDWPLGVWASPFAYWSGRRWHDVNIPQWMNDVTYLARVPHSDTMLATGGTTLTGGRFRGEIFAYGSFG